MENIVHTGSMYCLVVGILQKKQWIPRFYVLYGSSNSNQSRLDYFENEDVFLHEPKLRKSVFIEAIKEIHRRDSIVKGRGYVIELELDHNRKSLMLSCDSLEEMEQWLRHLQDEKRNSAAPPLPPTPIVRESRERNLSAGSYVSLAKPDYVSAIYPVDIAMTESARQCGLCGSYYLAITSCKLELRDTEGTSLYSWPYKFIRRYGRSSNSFTFEAGRKCESGSGLFTFLTSDGDVVFRTVQQQTQSLRQSTGSMLAGLEPPRLPERNSMLGHKGLSLGEEGQHRLPENEETKATSPVATPPMLKPIPTKPKVGQEYAQVMKGNLHQTLAKTNSGGNGYESYNAGNGGQVYYSSVSESPVPEEPDYAIYDITCSSRFAGHIQNTDYEEPVYELPEAPAPPNPTDASLGDICAKLRQQTIQNDSASDNYDTLMLSTATNSRATHDNTYACLGKLPLSRASSNNIKPSEEHLYDEVSISN